MPELALAVRGILFPLQISVRNESDAPAPAVGGSLARKIWIANCYVRALVDADGLLSENDQVNNAVSVEVKRR